mgnify:CR=1 FL=1
MSGLVKLGKLLLKEAAKESGKRSGIAQIGNVTREIAEKKFQAFVAAAKKQGVDLDNYSEQELKYIIQLNKPQSSKVISADSPQGKGITEALFGKRGQVIEGKFGKPFAEEMVTTERVITDIKKMKPMDSMLEANKVLKGEGKYKNLSQADREKIVNDESVTDHIFERDIPIDPEDMATGGRAGYQTGNQVTPQVDARMNIDYDTLVNQNQAQAATQAQSRNLNTNINALKASASVPYNFAKGILGNFSNPQDLTQVSLTDAQKARLTEIAKAKEVSFGLPEGFPATSEELSSMSWGDIHNLARKF